VFVTAAAHAQPVSAPSSHWEISLDSRVGVPTGSLQVRETTVVGTPLRLRGDLGIEVSEALEASVAYHLTPSDAVRATALYYFLNGSSTTNRPVAYNGEILGPGRLDSHLDFSRFSLDYERLLWETPEGMNLIGSVGLTFVALETTVNRNPENFTRQELPVPIVGLRLVYPLSPRLGLTASVSGGGLPRVDSLRQEGGTIYLRQSHADAEMALTYALSPALQVSAGYHFTYFFQHENSHEDDNRIELIDNAFQVRVTFRF
jgi:hypothetical protein